MFKNQTLNLSPKEFELEAKKILEAEGALLKDFRVSHREVLEGQDGEYEIDIVARFEALSVSFLVLAECKRYKSPVKREVVQAFEAKLQSIGAQKGIVFSTSGFQSGALEYARLHGIALIRIDSGRTMYLTRSMEEAPEPPPEYNIPQVIGWLYDPFADREVMSVISSMRGDALVRFLKKS